MKNYNKEEIETLKLVIKNLYKIGLSDDQYLKFKLKLEKRIRYLND